MCQILNSVITSCISFVLVYFLITSYVVIFVFPSGHDRLRPNEMKLAPNLGRCAAHLGGTNLRLLNKIYSSSSGVEASRFKFRACSLILTSECLKNESQKWEHSCLILKEGAKWELSSCIGCLDFRRFGTNSLSLGNYLSGIQ